MNAQPKLRPVPDAAPIGTAVEGGYLVDDETLELLGRGDVKYGRACLRAMIADERDHQPRPGPNQKPASVRVAGPDDEARVVGLIIECLSRSVAKWAPISPERILEHVQIGTQTKGGIVGVIEDDDRVVACIVLMPKQPDHSKIWYMHEVWSVVHPNYRRSTHGRDLIDFAKWTADELSRSWGFRVYTIMHVNAEKNARKIIRFFRRFLRQIGGTFIYPTV